MKPNHTESLIVKYLHHTINKVELEELTSWLEQPGNTEVFKEYVRIDHSVNYKLGTFNTEEVKKLVDSRIRKDKRKYAMRSVFKISKYAAVFVIIAMAVHFFRKEPSSSLPKGPIQNENTITLELHNGNSVILKEDDSQDIISGNGKVIGKQVKQGIDYKNTDANITEVVYNTLKVPYGKKFQLTLSDGTEVFLNAGSSIRFPVKFISGEDRIVFLSGEAFFEVAKNKIPFIVNTDNLDIKVLGTQFNVSSYPEDRSMRTVLVEGSIQLEGKNPKETTRLLLQPEHEAIWDKIGKSMVVTKADISLSTAWMNNQLVFRAVAFKDIIKKLERSYNCKIINTNRALDEEIFSATFNVDIESIEQVMVYILKNSPYRYTISENKIITIN